MAATVADEAVPAKRKRNREPEFTSRDRRALEWIGEQYGARLDVVAVLLGRFGNGDKDPVSRSTVRQVIERWKRLEVVSTSHALGDTWVTLTRKGLNRLELPFPIWAVPVTRLRHCHAINVVRLWWESQSQSERSPWVSERRCYAERGRSGNWHIPDGKVIDPKSVDVPGPDRFIAIEIELTHKERKEYANEVFAKLPGGTEAVLYMVPDDAFAARLRANVTAVLEQRGQATPFQIQLLPEVSGVTYSGRW